MHHPQDNIRALLASLHTVLWEGSGWTPPGMADMVEGAKVWVVVVWWWWWGRGSRTKQRTSMLRKRGREASALLLDGAAGMVEGTEPGGEV